MKISVELLFHIYVSLCVFETCLPKNGYSCKTACIFSKGELKRKWHPLYLFQFSIHQTGASLERKEFAVKELVYSTASASISLAHMLSACNVGYLKHLQKFLTVFFMKIQHSIHILWLYKYQVNQKLRPNSNFAVNVMFSPI